MLLGRPALANPHWPIWAARELGHEDPFELVPEDRGWWLQNFRGHDPSIGRPVVDAPAPETVAGGPDSETVRTAESARAPGTPPEPSGPGRGTQARARGWLVA